MSSLDVYTTKESAIAHAKTINNLEHRAMFCSQHQIPFEYDFMAEIHQIIAEDLKDRDIQVDLGETDYRGDRP